NKDGPHHRVVTRRVQNTPSSSEEYARGVRWDRGRIRAPVQGSRSFHQDGRDPARKSRRKVK
ncbi:hypothetical protein NPIL_282481, partial [Nephila pilipes]